jgi:hypothetical protein
MAYRIAGIDVHKKMLAVVIADVEVVGTWQFERRQIGTSPNQLRGQNLSTLDRGAEAARADQIVEDALYHQPAGLPPLGDVPSRPFDAPSSKSIMRWLDQTSRPPGSSSARSSAS